MNVGDIPMVLFTVITQMCVGAFVTLGLIQVLASLRHDQDTVERLTHPVLYAIGPAMVLGLAVSTLHMHDPFHALNVIRHWGSSWLSREILFGCSFAGAGFLFALLEWFHAGSFALRRALAVLTALLGIGLIVAESMIYYTLTTVPAWHTWAVPLHFAGTTIILGSLCVACALMITVLVRRRTQLRTTTDTTTTDTGADTDTTTDTGADADTDATNGSRLSTQVRTRVHQINAPTTPTEWALTTRIIQWCAVTAAITGAVLLASYPPYLQTINAAGTTGQEALHAFTGPLLILRLTLLAAAVLLLGFFVHRTAGTALQDHPTLLAWLITTTFILATAGELIARNMHYSALIRVGI